jgi:hypothetical protein
MSRFVRIALLTLPLLGAAACYRLPLRIRENDASGYEDVGIPVIEAVEYTPNGRDIRVALEGSGYVTIIVVDPEKGATVRFRRGDFSSTFAEKGIHRFPLDRLSSPMTLAMLAAASSGSNVSHGLGRPAIRGAAPRSSTFEPSVFNPARADSIAAQSSVSLSSRSVSAPGSPVTSVHVVVLVTEHPLDLIGVATRLARGSLDPALVAQSAANVIEGGRWMAATAQLRGQ